MNKTIPTKISKRRLIGPSEKSIQNMIDYFADLTEHLSKTNGLLLPEENRKLQQKYKVSWGTISIAKKFKHIESGERKHYKMLKEVNRVAAIKIIKQKYGGAPDRFEVVSTDPYELKGIYLKKGRRTEYEAQLVFKLSKMLGYIFKFDRRYQNSFKEPKTFKSLERSIIKYQKILDYQRSKRGIISEEIQPGLFDNIPTDFFENVREVKSPIKVFTKTPAIKKENDSTSSEKNSYGGLQKELLNQSFEDLKKSLLKQQQTSDQSEIIRDILKIYNSIIKKRYKLNGSFIFQYSESRNNTELFLLKQFLTKINYLLIKDIDSEYILTGYRNEFIYIKSNEIVNQINTIKNTFGEGTYVIVEVKDLDYSNVVNHLLVYSFNKALPEARMKELQKHFEQVNYKNERVNINKGYLNSFVLENENTFSVNVPVDYKLSYDGNWSICNQVNSQTLKEVNEYKKKTFWIVQEKREATSFQMPFYSTEFQMEYVKWWKNKKDATTDAHTMAKINPGKNYFVSMVTDIISAEVTVVQKNLDISEMVDLMSEDEDFDDM